MSLLQGIADLIDRCLLPDPEQRPSAEQIFQLLQAELKQSPGGAASVSHSVLSWPDATVQHPSTAETPAECKAPASLRTLTPQDSGRTDEWPHAAAERGSSELGAPAPRPQSSLPLSPFEV